MSANSVAEKMQLIELLGKLQKNDPNVTELVIKPSEMDQLSLFSAALIGNTRIQSVELMPYESEDEDSDLRVFMSVLAANCPRVSSFKWGFTNCEELESDDVLSVIHQLKDFKHLRKVGFPVGTGTPGGPKEEQLQAIDFLRCNPAINDIELELIFNDQDEETDFKQILDYLSMRKYHRIAFNAGYFHQFVFSAFNVSAVLELYKSALSKEAWMLFLTYIQKSTELKKLSLRKLESLPLFNELSKCMKNSRHLESFILETDELTQFQLDSLKKTMGEGVFTHIGKARVTKKRSRKSSSEPA